MTGDSQHGFSEGTLCLTNLVAFYDEITALVDKGRATDITYLDLCKAFGSALHDDILTPNENSNFPYQVPSFHKCDICLLSFPRETQFQRHMRDHEQNDKPHRCDQCPMSFNVEFNLTLHKCTHNGEDPTCPVCNKKFSRVASLKAHIMLHEKEENLICSECGDEFTLQSQLSIHMEEHRQELAGSRIHSCKSCKKEFETSSQLKEHMKTHYKIRVSNTRSYNRNIDRSGFTYSCPHCGKTFQKPSQLTRHVRIHTGERPFKCSECGKAFNQKGALQTHMIKHTGEKPHACAFCPAAFSQKGNLQSHIQRVHSEVKNGPTYNCTECSCVFKSLGSLNTHISKMHMGGPQNSASASTDVSHVTSVSFAWQRLVPALPKASYTQGTINGWLTLLPLRYTISGWLTALMSRLDDPQLMVAPPMLARLPTLQLLAPGTDPFPSTVLPAPEAGLCSKWPPLQNRYGALDNESQISNDEIAERQPEAIKRDFRALGRMLEGSGAQVVFASIPSITRKNSGRFKKVKQLNTWLKGWCQRSSFGFFNHGEIYTAPGPLKPDGIQMTSVGKTWQGTSNPGDS
ncbi:PREDICTED: zinc finger protein 236-like [Apaloderma vittatum]|uniref:zinc finger protein 236-like n=1 Tax=Apaloderma vittatum TaxID=57397 RepID=UPI0005211E62|nr:PREDICTED: zinc finger protein 236-like [Apaloderma vittatum]